MLEHSLNNLGTHSKERGGAIVTGPIIILIVIYLTGFFVDLADGFIKASDIDQTLALAAASATTSISKPQFYQHGQIDIATGTAYSIALSQIKTSLPTDVRLTSPVDFVAKGAADCIRAKVTITLPFPLLPFESKNISYTDSSSALAKGSGTQLPPTC